VKQVLKSVVREIRTIRSEGIGAPNLVTPSTRRVPGDSIPTAT